MYDIPFSKKYLYDLKVLHREHAEKRITDEELSQLSDELREREAKLNESLGHILLMQKLGDAEKAIEDEVKQEVQEEKQAYEAKEWTLQVEQTRQIQKQRREKQNEEQKLRKERIDRDNERLRYKKEIDKYINRLEYNAQRWQIRYTWLQIILLVFSAITATTASIDGIPRWMVSTVGLIATLAGGFLTTFKIQDRIYASRKAVAEVILECQKYDHRIEEYKDMAPEEAFIKFSRSITAIQGQQMLQEVELWNPKQEDSKEEKILNNNINIKEDLEDQTEQESNEISSLASPETKLLE